MTQAHGQGLWTEPAQTGGVAAVVQAYLVLSSGDWTISLTPPEDGFAADDGTGDFIPYTTAAAPTSGTRLRLVSVLSDIISYPAPI